MHRGQRKRAYGLNPKLLQTLNCRRETSLFLHQGNRHGLLMLVYPPGQRLFLCDVGRRTNARLVTSVAQVPIDLIRGFVELRDGVKLDDLTQFADEKAKEFLGVMLLPNCVSQTYERFITCCERLLFPGFPNCANHAYLHVPTPRCLDATYLLTDALETYYGANKQLCAGFRLPIFLSTKDFESSSVL